MKRIYADRNTTRLTYVCDDKEPSKREDEESNTKTKRILDAKQRTCLGKAAEHFGQEEE